MRATAPVSLVIPAHNAERFLEIAIESARSQVPAPAEIILVDDGSTDGTPAIAARLVRVVRSVRQDNAGPGAARNAGIRLAREEFVAFLDADDLWPPGSLASRLSRFESDPTLEVVMGRSLWIAEPGSDPGWAAPGLHAAPLFGSALFRRSVFDRVGLLDEGLRYGEDQDYFLRLRERDVRLVILPAITLHYRRHGGNMTAQTGWAKSTVFRFLKKSLDRRRIADGQARDLKQLSDYAEPGDGDEPAS